jgi:acyl-CoA-binding protein/predicted ester cyclase
MSSEQKFQKACSKVEKNSTKISQSTLLKLYSYYKQATEGTATGERPGLMSLRSRAKYDGWKALGRMSSEEAKGNYIRVVSELEFVDLEPLTFEEKHAAAKEMLDRELDPEEYEEIKKLWKAHSVAEDNRDIEGLMATLTEDCRYEIPQIGKIYENKVGATQFYNDLLGAFPDIDFRLIQIYIGPQGVVEEARVKATHEKDWLVIPASGQKIEFETAIFFPWDSKARKFKGERVYFNFDRKFYEKYGIAPPFPELKE